MPAPLPPIDPDVKMPANVAAAAAAAEAAHKQAYTQPASPQPDTPASPPAVEPVPAPSLAPPPAPPPAQPPEPQPQPPQAPAQVVPQPQMKPAKAPPAEALSAEEWRNRYLAMEGRHRQAVTSLGALQEQLSETGDELMRTQEALQRRAPAAPQAPQIPQPIELTPQELSDFSPELINVVQKVARAAVMPDLQKVHTGVRQVSQRVQQVGIAGVQQALDDQVPNWREIDHSPEFKQWVSLPDVYSGMIRRQLLNAAYTAGNAARVVAFFKGFLAEGQATGALPDPNVIEPVIPPRTPTVPLEMLAAPGRARPAGGETPAASADKPHFTRAQIKAFYDAVRAQLYVGRDAEKNATEQAIFAAQREGRVHG